MRGHGDITSQLLGEFAAIMKFVVSIPCFLLSFAQHTIASASVVCAVDLLEGRIKHKIYFWTYFESLFFHHTLLLKKNQMCS